jgi:N-acetylmuramoyl-L-alanine amidase
MSKKFKYLIIHCTATYEGVDVPAQRIKDFHTLPRPKGRGWSRVGYSDLILLDGTRHKFVEHDNDLFIDEKEITWGVASINSVARHVCYVGGVSSKTKKGLNTLTEAQDAVLQDIIVEVLNYAPDVLIAGHNQFDNKACPSFWVPLYLRDRGCPEANIYTADPFKWAKRGYNK